MISRIERAVKVLNELLVADPDATNELFKFAVIVNKTVCDHPTIQVRGEKDSLSGLLRMIGLLNGVLQEGNQRITMIVDDGPDKKITKFVIGNIDKDGTVTIPGPNPACIGPSGH